MLYFIIALIALAGFISGFIIILFLWRLTKRKKPGSDAPAEKQPAVQSVVQPEIQPEVQSETQSEVQSEIQPVVQTIYKSKAISFKTKPAAVSIAAETAATVSVPLKPDEDKKPAFFTLSRKDVLDHISDMQKKDDRFTVKPFVNEKTDEKNPDFLMCGDWCFGMMFDRNDIVFNFILRMSEESANRYGRIYTVQNASPMSGENWYSLTIDNFFTNKSEVYKILDDCYDFTLKTCFTKKKKDNAEEPKSEQAELEKRLAENLSLVEKAIAAAEINYRAELEKYKTAQSAVQPVIQPEAQPVVQPKDIPETVPVIAGQKAVSVAAEPEKEEQKPVLFTLSRNDVIDHILKMQKNGERFPIKPDINEKTNEKMPDYLMCGGWCFGMMFDRNDIIFNFVLRMSEAMANRYSKCYSIESAPSISGEKWYNLIIDSYFENKNDVYLILEDCCEFTLRENFAKKKKDNIEAKAEQDAKTEQFSKAEQIVKTEQDAKAEQTAKIEQAAKEEQDAKAEQAAKAEMAKLEKKVIENLGFVEKAAAAAETDYRAKLEKYKAEHYTNFYITRKEIAEETRKLENPDITIIERPKQPQLPMSLRYKDKTYAMLHGTDTGVIMIVRLCDEYAESLAVKHPEICRTRFPKGANWYQLPIDGAFKDKESVCRILNISREFVAGKIASSKRGTKRGVLPKQMHQ